MKSVHKSDSRTNPANYRPTDVTNTLLQNIDKGQLTGLVFLDLTKAFDTLDHSVLLDKSASVGFSKASVQWFTTYLDEHLIPDPFHLESRKGP